MAVSGRSLRGLVVFGLCVLFVRRWLLTVWHRLGINPSRVGDLFIFLESLLEIFNTLAEPLTNFRDLFGTKHNKDNHENDKKLSGTGHTDCVLHLNEIRIHDSYLKILGLFILWTVSKSDSKCFKFEAKVSVGA